MCYIALAGLAIAAGAAGYSSYQQNEQATKQNRYQKQVKQEGELLAKHAYALSVQQENVRQSQEQEAGAQQIQQNMMRAASAKATARVSAGESGVSGLSVDTLLADFDKQEAIFNGSVRTNRAYGRQQYGMNIQGAQSTLAGRNAGLMFPMAQGPGYYGAALRIAGAGLDAYNTNHEATQRAENNTN